MTSKIKKKLEPIAAGVTGYAFGALGGIIAGFLGSYCIPTTLREAYTGIEDIIYNNKGPKKSEPVADRAFEVFGTVAVYGHGITSFFSNIGDNINNYMENGIDISTGIFLATNAVSALYEAYRAGKKSE